MGIANKVFNELYSFAASKDTKVASSAISEMGKVASFSKDNGVKTEAINVLHKFENFDNPEVASLAENTAIYIWNSIM